MLHNRGLLGLPTPGQNTLVGVLAYVSEFLFNGRNLQLTNHKLCSIRLDVSVENRIIRIKIIG